MRRKHSLLIAIAAIVAVVAIVGVSLYGLTSSTQDPPQRKSEAVIGGRCKKVKFLIRVALSERLYPEVAKHIKESVRKGLPRILHLDRNHAEENRKRAIKDFPVKEGLDRDEYPPAITRESKLKTDVVYLSPAQNRGSGASMGNQLKPYCNGQQFQILVVG